MVGWIAKGGIGEKRPEQLARKEMDTRCNLNVHVHKVSVDFALNIVDIYFTELTVAYLFLKEIYCDTMSTYACLLVREQMIAITGSDDGD